MAAVFAAGNAHLKVTRVVRNESDAHEQVSRSIAVPAGAVITSFRAGPAGQWNEPATLRGTEENRLTWSSLTGPGQAMPSTLGLLEWTEENELVVTLFGLPPHGDVEVQYELDAPTTYEGGAVSLDVPLEVETPGWLAPTFDLSLVESMEPSSEENGGTVHLRRSWATRELADARWATFPIEQDLVAWRFELEASTRFSTVPSRPNVVFVIDASHSTGAENIAAQLQVLTPYLSHVPDANVEVVVFRRFAERLFGRFVPAADVARELSRVPAEKLAPGNGSNLELGVQLALEALRPMSGPARVVVFTDELLRTAYSNELVLPELERAGQDLVLHVVARQSWSSSPLSLNRDDDRALAPLARATGGVFFGLDGEGGHDAVLDAAGVLDLVRPTHIDFFAPEVAVAGLDLGPTLEEGQGIEFGQLGIEAPERVVLVGQLWSKPWRLEVNVDRALDQRLPGLVVGDDSMRQALDDDQLRSVATVAHAVSPVTSFLAAPRDAAPSVIGVVNEVEGDGFGHVLGVGCGGCGGSSSCGFGSFHSSIDFDGILNRLLASGRATCEARFGSMVGAEVWVEATGDEVVDVKVRGVGADAAACVTEAVWGVRLSAEFTSSRAYFLRW